MHPNVNQGAWPWQGARKSLILSVPQNVPVSSAFLITQRTPAYDASINS